MQVLAITMGDASGIGPEIIAKFFAAGVSTPAIVIGDAGCLERTVHALRLPLKIRAIVSPSEGTSETGTIDVLSLSNLPADLPLGKVDARSGQAAYDYIVSAIDFARKGEIAGIVTAPIHKEAFKAAGITYPGHTEILADRSGTSDFAMMLANEELRVILVTIHVSIRAVPDLITKARVLKTIQLAHAACLAYDIAEPRIAVAGLNPHAGEGGLFGHEDEAEIAPAIREAQTLGMKVSGPYAGDTVFMRARRGEFDIVVAQYHDQGLIPVKYMGIEQGVNVTIGLPFIRTSVDHGTAFDIAGQGIADASSLAYAFEQARLLQKVAAR
ncbi:MAG: 4-hydroxythreonine-4-phosphate dehydrogenase PdxA [Beijerinckiaceae bacterium]|nr:4-hydroxythreonine-4-phosphate dehydrogenase PdxA [Beijerinckiaceae bacterium]